MDTQLNHNFNMPLIQDQTLRFHENNQNPQTDSPNTSFLTTCLNGLNVLSGTLSLLLTHYSLDHNLIQFPPLLFCFAYMQISFFIMFLEFVILYIDM